MSEWISEVGLELLGQLKGHFVFECEFEKNCKVLCCLSLISILSHLSWINLSHNLGDFMNIKERKGNTLDKLARSSQNQYLSKSTEITTNTETAMLSTTLYKICQIHTHTQNACFLWSLLKPKPENPPHMTGDNHQHQQSAHCSLNTIQMIFWWHYVSFFKRKAPLGEYSWRLCPCSPWKEAHSCRHRFSGKVFLVESCYWTRNLVEKIVRKECMSESPTNGQHAMRSSIDWKILKTFVIIFVIL